MIDSKVDLAFASCSYINFRFARSLDHGDSRFTITKIPTAISSMEEKEVRMTSAYEFYVH